MTSPEEQKDEKKYSPSEDTSDPCSAIYGDFGRWQMLCFLLVGFTIIVCCQPTLIMTFMNAKIDFWCQRPENLRDLDTKEWRALSGSSDENCQIFNLTYVNMTLIEAKR